RFAGIDVFAESYQSLTPNHFAANNPISFSDPTGMYIREYNGSITYTRTDEISELQQSFDGRVDDLAHYMKDRQVFKEDIPELALSGSKLYTALTGNYFNNSDKKEIFNHLNKHIGTMATITEWDGDKGFWGNWGTSDSFLGKLSYNIANNTYLAFQVVDTFNWLGGKNISGVTGEQVYSNLDNTTQFNAGERGFAFVSTFNPLSAELKVLGVGQQVLPKTAFRLTDDLAPLSAPQFSSLFKGTVIARAKPTTRGLLNRNMNKGLNMINNISMFKMGYTSVIKPFSPNKKEEK
ncbi:hypothetical protein, partial [Chryseobacterium tongliaoense]|uniref:hypothetical protein n=1 Tax=Chryseobacterium tongliaoense TaxID=3240933 RepID=UPI00351245E8